MSFLRGARCSVDCIQDYRKKGIAGVVVEPDARKVEIEIVDLFFKKKNQRVVLLYKLINPERCTLVQRCLFKTQIMRKDERVTSGKVVVSRVMEAD